MRTEFERRADRAITGVKHLFYHAKTIAIECTSRLYVSDGQDQVIKACQLRHCNFTVMESRATMPASQTETQTHSERLDPARAQALHATLGLPGALPQAGQQLPSFWHQIYFWDAQPPENLGADCHPKTGTGLIPDLGLPQRMWAGGRVQFHSPLTIGNLTEKVSVVERVDEKIGRTGRLGFVTLRHEYRQSGVMLISEHQQLVYKNHSRDRSTIDQPPARVDEDVVQTHNFTSTQLFRYSALTFNGHRIHYDVDYARDAEGYDGLVVHGPLLAQLLIRLAEQQIGPLREFEFRAISPVIDFETVDLCWCKDGSLWVRGPDGRLCITAKAR